MTALVLTRACALTCPHDHGENSQETEEKIQIHTLSTFFPKHCFLHEGLVDSTLSQKRFLEVVTAML